MSAELAPSFVQLDAANLCLADLVRRGDCILGSGVRPNGDHLLWGKLRRGMTASSGLAPLRRPVGCVFNGRSKKEMIQRAARPRVAPMANADSLWNRTSRLHPHESVGFVRLPAPFDAAISANIKAARPKRTPLVVRRRDIARQSLSKRPVTRATKPLYFGGSHISTSNAVIGQGRCRRLRVARPAHSTSSARNGHRHSLLGRGVSHG